MENEIIKEEEEETTQKTTNTVPEVEVHLYVKGKGPLHVFKSRLGGWGQDRLDLVRIMDDYGLKALYAYSVMSGRGQILRFSPRNGLSILPYKPTLVCLDGEPKDSLIKPISKILMVLALVTVLLSIIMSEDPPEWVQKLKDAGGGSVAWAVAILVFVYSRLRKKFPEMLRRYGWL